MNKYLILILLLINTHFLQSQEGSVVCIHGFFRSYKCMIPLANVMRDEGHKVYLWNYQSRKKTIETHAEHLVEVLNAIAKAFPNEPIHFVTHSLGGIIVRAAVSHPNCPPEAKMGRAVLLAPPNRGSALARRFQDSSFMRFVFGKRAGSQLLTFQEEEMSNLGQFPPSMKILVVAGDKGNPFFYKWLREPNDGKVTVEETRLNSLHEHQVLHVSHHWIMTSRESIALTKKFLTENPPQK